MRSHLNSDEIERLLLSASDLGGEPNHEGAQSDAFEHFRACESCQMMVRAHREAAEELARLKPSGIGPRGLDCPSENVWMDLAAGISIKDSESYLNHAAKCEHCGPLLREAAADLAEEISLEDDKQIEQLRSARPEWQRDLAHRLSVVAQASGGVPSWKSIFTLPRLAFVGALASLLAFALWSSFSLLRSPSPDRLLANAYAEKRTIEMRFEGAPYVAMSQERGGNDARNRMSRPALLRAESEIAERLRSEPDEVTWLHARGRASLLEGDPDTAISSLEKAQQFAPDDASVATDLATAYSQRAESLNRPEDDGRAVDILGKVLATNPNNEVARFNYAIALERLSLYHQAIEQWSTFLKLHPSSEWAPEAQTRRSQIELKVREQEKQSRNRARTAADIAESLEGQPNAVFDELDGKAESYLDAAIREWLPNVFVSGSTGFPSSRADWIALSALSQILKSRHEDIWLQDLLRADRSSSGVRDAFKLMADVAHLIDNSANDQAGREAMQEASLFKEFKVPAGELYARFQLAYVDQLSHRNMECSAIANGLLASRELRSYPWLRVQAEIESADCASTSDEKAVATLKEGFALATLHHYVQVGSRAHQVLSAVYWVMGDSRDAWSTSTQGLRQYWTSALPPLLGYNLLTNLDYLAEDRQESFLQASVLKESLLMIANDPDQAMRAFEQTRLGEALLMTHDLKGAEASFREAQVLFKATPDGSRKDNLAAESEIGLAKVDLQLGFVERATERLRAIRQRVKLIPDDDLNLDFLQTYGIALLRAERQTEALECLTSSVQLSENGLRLVHNERDRLSWSRRNEPTYRAIVELTLQTDPTLALALWEWYKSASLRGVGSSPSVGLAKAHYRIVLPRFAQTDFLSKDTALVTFLLVDNGIVVWVSDAKGTQERWLNANPRDLESLARRFAEHCSQPSSSLVGLRHESSTLYELIISPIEPLIRDHRALLFEPDGDLRLIPFVALLDRSDRYLGDRYAIAISPGIGYIAASAEWKGLSHDSRVLVVGNPMPNGSSSLPEAEQEARGVAAAFSHPILLLRADASYENIVRELPQSEVFHFAGHAVANSATAALLLSYSESMDVLSLEALRLHNSQLVVLSACSSADGSTGLFDDEDSLARRLIGSGTPEVVASRWGVDSAATAILMDDFYQRLLSGDAVADALTAAANKTRSRAGFEHPFYWAGFSVFGRG